MRRSASETIRNLEKRIAQLENHRTAGSSPELEKVLKQVEKVVSEVDRLDMEMNNIGIHDEFRNIHGMGREYNSFTESMSGLEQFVKYAPLFVKSLKEIIASK